MLFGKNTVDKESAMLGRDASEREVTRISEEGRRRREWKDATQARSETGQMLDDEKRMV